MRLGRIRRNVWDVLAVLDDRDNCVLDQLEALRAEVGSEVVDHMVGILRNHVPDYGPGFNNTNFSSSLGGGLFQFKRGKKKGPRLRVSWFYGGRFRRQAIICVDAFSKRNQTPDWALENGAAAKREYDAAARELEIKEL